MSDAPRTEPVPLAPDSGFYCPACQCTVDRPLVCGDCTAVICRECGTPLDRIDDLGIG